MSLDRLLCFLQLSIPFASTRVGGDLPYDKQIFFMGLVAIEGLVHSFSFSEGNYSEWARTEMILGRHLFGKVG